MKRNVILIAISIILLGILIFYINDARQTGQVIEENSQANGLSNLSNLSSNAMENQVKEGTLYFYDRNTNCSLNGEVYINDVMVGNSEEGKIIIENEEYGVDSKVEIKGNTDYCFGKNVNLPFFASWTVPDLGYYVQSGGLISLGADLNLRNPGYYEEMQGFIRPQEVQGDLAQIGISSNDSLKENMDKIYKFYYLSYMSDTSLFNTADYWQTPAETRINRGGDCEDWAVKFLSMLRAYNDSLNCYVALWDTHANVICRIGTQFLIYDQDRVNGVVKLESNYENDSSITQENKVIFRGMLNNYFKEYGLSVNQRKLSALFNDKELITFNSTEDFVDWAVNFTH